MAAPAGMQGANLYTDCIVPLDADTGRLKWQYQEVPHDEFDFDAAYEATLIDLEQNGRKRKL
jgi:alcohol dehydrogenase (cytochrome c)